MNQNEMNQKEIETLKLEIIKCMTYIISEFSKRQSKCLNK